MPIKIKYKNAYGNILTSLILICFFLVNFFFFPEAAYSEEQKLQVFFIRQAEEALNFSIIDVNGNGINEVVVSNSGFLHIYEWTDAKFVEKWKSSQYSYVLPGSPAVGLKPMTMYFVSTVFPVQYKSGAAMKRSLLFYAKPVPNKSDLYELSVHNGHYGVQKRLEMLSLSSFRSTQLVCNDQTTILGNNPDQNKYEIAAYAWNGKELTEKWPGLPIRNGAVPGQLFITPAAKKNVVLLRGSENDILYCEKSQYRTKAIGKISAPFPGYNVGRSVIGITKRESRGELWTIEAPNSEGAFFYKLYVSQFDGSKFSSFKKAHIKGVNTDRVSAINIVDLDNDGIGEIIGSEVAGTLVTPEEGEGPALKGERSYIFAAKWNGTGYVLIWRQLAAAGKIDRISIDDVTGDGNKEIIAEGYSLTKNNFSLYVFKMPMVGNY